MIVNDCALAATYHLGSLKLNIFLMFLYRNVRQWRQRNKEQTDKVEIETSLKELTETKDKTSSDSSEGKPEEENSGKKDEASAKEDGEKMETDSSENTNNDNTSDGVKDGSSVKEANDLDIIDNTECKFNVNSFKLVYVVNSESYLYKRMALQRAREVNIV